MAPRKMFIIDAMAMAFRNFHAFGVRPLSNSQGLPTSAIFGSAQFLLKIITEQRPDYLVIATDTSEKTFRHDLYPLYKANRSDMPEDLSVQIPHLFKLFTHLGAHLMMKPGVEADDLIASLVCRFRSQNLHCYIVSGDKDFMQLIDDETCMYVPQKGADAKVVGASGVMEKFGCRPDQVIDILALMGDSSDNVPGVRGVGEKGAAKLISSYGNLDGIYANLDNIANGKVKQALIDHRDMAYLSRKLVSLDCDITPLPELESLHYPGPEKLANEDLLKFFDEMEFRRLSEMVQGLLEVKRKAEVTTTSISTADVGSERIYRCVNTTADLGDLIRDLRDATVYAFDTETTGLNIVTDSAIGMSFAVRPGEAYYLPLRTNKGSALPLQESLAALAPIFADSQKTMVAHNLKFDWQMLIGLGIRPQNRLADTMLASYALNSSARSHSLDFCCLTHLNYTKIPTTDLIGKHAETSMLDVDQQVLTTYACEDADYTLRLYNFFAFKLHEEGVFNAYQNIDIPLIPILAAMELEGVYVDRGTLSDISLDLTAQARILEEKIFELAGERFNVNSTKQLQAVIFEKLKIHEELGLNRLKKNKSGYSTDVTVLERMSAHPLPAALLEYRSVAKLLNTYVDALPLLINEKTGRIHTCFQQTGTATGRLSSTNPNLQNIPIRTPMGRLIRKAFSTSNPRHVLISADYSQVELRILAHIANDDGLAAAFRQGHDIHTATAARIFGLAPEAVDRDTRSKAKAINFGIIYGMGASRLARETGVTYREAEDFIQRYFASYPGIAAFIDRAIADAKANQCTRTLSGRKRPFSNDEDYAGSNPENIAVNSPIQGSAADLVKLSMIKVVSAAAAAKLNLKLLIQVHDELVFECDEQDADAALALIRTSMEQAMDLRVPLAVDIGVGKNWLEAH